MKMLAISFPVHKDEYRNVEMDLCEAIDKIRRKRMKKAKDKNIRIIEVTLSAK